MTRLVGNGRYAGEEFISELNKATSSDSISITGLAKASESDCAHQILFTQTARDDGWLAVPAKMIDSVDVLGAINIKSERCPVVRLSLRKPSEPEETAVLASLLEQREIEDDDETWPLRRAALGGDGSIPVRLLLAALSGDGSLPLRLRLAALGGDGSIPVRLLLAALSGDGSLPI